MFSGKRLFPALVLLALLAAVGSASAQTCPAKSKGQLVYVPLYSHIFTGDRERPLHLAGTLSIRNIDPKISLTLLKVDYHDSNGRIIRNCLAEPVGLGPLASRHFFIKETDKGGGSGACFLVRWRSATKAAPPLIESVMISTRSQQGISFTSRGRVIENKAE